MKQEYKKIRERIDALLEEKQVLIAAHRGSSGGNIMENTPRSTAVALRQKADIIEMDVACDTDGNYYMVHDGMEFRLFSDPKNITSLSGAETKELIFYNSNKVPCGKPCTLDEMLEDIKKRGCIANVDRSWRYWDSIYPVFERHDMLDQLLFKSPAEEPFLTHFKKHFGNAMYMPMIYCPEDLERAKAANVNLVGAEILFDKEDSPQATEDFLKKMKSEHMFCWGNAITLGGQFNLSAWHDDDNAITGDPAAPDRNWGWLVRRGFNVIQTDWPMLLDEYLKTIVPGRR